MTLNSFDSIIHVPLFNCIQLRTEQFEVYQPKIELVDYLLTTYPRIAEQDSKPFAFAHTYFVDNRIAFSANQGQLLSLSNFLFADSKPLGYFEQQVLNDTYKQSLSKTPSRPNRQ